MSFYDNIVAFKKDDIYWLITMENDYLTINTFDSYGRRWNHQAHKTDGHITKSQFKIEEIFKLISDFTENTLDLDKYSIEFANYAVSITNKVSCCRISIQTFDRGDSDNNPLLETCKNTIIIKNLLREVALLKDQVATFNDIRNMMNSFMELNNTGVTK